MHASLYNGSGVGNCGAITKKIFFPTFSTVGKKSGTLEVAFHSVKVLCCNRRLQYYGSGNFSGRIEKNSSFKGVVTHRVQRWSFFRSGNSIGEAHVPLFIFDFSEY
ncbi:unnamed protein product [Brugia pahangi]|uniref:PHR domain-containing protein n=1 Tax=Brugia pahangi TaxID=6280 RepID=A0A0N4TK19_BRUPA|nr:unnamed protein product [Brugia pahangi]